MSTLAIMMVLLLVVPGARADIDGATEAYQRGDYREASREFARLAETGEAQAQLMIGYMQLLDVADRSFRDGFDGVVLVNRGGDYAVAAIEVRAAP